jgi:hypothetical protein
MHDVFIDDLLALFRASDHQSNVHSEDQLKKLLWISLTPDDG